MMNSNLPLMNKKEKIIPIPQLQPKTKFRTTLLCNKSSSSKIHMCITLFLLLYIFVLYSNNMSMTFNYMDFEKELLFNTLNLNLNLSDTGAERLGDVHHDQQQQRRLEFVHIPKTGGTAIESIAADANITWSLCQFGYIKWKLDKCLPNELKYVWPLEEEFNNFMWWHVPPVYVMASYPKHNPYIGADMFTVVRNPYERMISEYYYRIQVKNKRGNGMNDEQKFNDNLNKQLSNFFSESRRPHASRKLPGNKNYFMNSGHMIPQYDFVYDVDRHKKIVKHVLRFENLREEFSTLMEQYNLPLELPSKKIGRASDNKLLGVHNLTNENLLLIETIYWDDFLEFGYEMLSSNMTEDGISGD